MAWPIDDLTSVNVAADGNSPLLSRPEIAATINKLKAVLLSGGLTVAANVSIGLNSLNANTTGVTNVAIGGNALSFNTTGYSNIAIGKGSLSSNTTGNSNIGIGLNSALSITTAINNTAIGYSALNYGNSDNNTAIGGNALLIGGGGDNTAIGSGAMRVSSLLAVRGVAVGSSALVANTTGYENVAVGESSLTNNYSGSQNTAIGRSSISANTTGSNNVAVGNLALSANTTGFTNTALGAYAFNAGVSYNNTTALGYNAQPIAVNSITLGDANIISLRCNVTAISALSDRRDKTNIIDLPIGIEFINKLRPVKFDWNRRDGSMCGISEAGFIAQELDVAQVGAEYLALVLHDDPERLEAAPGKLVPVLVKAVQELFIKNTELEARLAAAGIA